MPDEEGKVVDNTDEAVNNDGGNTPDSSTGSEADNTDGSSASEENNTTPFDQHPKWKKAREAEKNLQNLLETKGFDSVDELVDQLEQGSKLSQELSGRDLDDILSKAETLEKYEAHWAEQERLKARENKSESEIIEDLESELSKVKNERQSEADRIKQEQEVKKSVEFFETEISTLVAKQDSIPDDYKPFVEKFLGSGNPMFDVDPTSKMAIRKTASELMKEINAFEQAIIKRFKEGKLKVPTTPSSSQGTDTASSATEPKPIKNLKDARTVLMEKLSKIGAK